MKDPAPSFDPKEVFQLPWTVRKALRTGQQKVDERRESAALLGAQTKRVAPDAKRPELSLLMCRTGQTRGGKR